MQGNIEFDFINRFILRIPFMFRHIGLLWLTPFRNDLVSTIVESFSYLSNATSTHAHGLLIYEAGPKSSVSGHITLCTDQLAFGSMHEGLDGGVWNSLISKNLAHYSLSLKFLLIL